MIALSRGVFERRCDIAGFHPRIVRENLFAARAPSAEIEHVLDSNAQTPQAGPPHWFGLNVMRCNSLIGSSKTYQQVRRQPT
jgi:hypothetical protein